MSDWVAFNPGFDHGDVTVRKSNIDGVFTADKIALLSKEELLGTEVRTANLGGQIGEESFDWRAADTGGADVRMAAASASSARRASSGRDRPDRRAARTCGARTSGTTIGESTSPARRAARGRVIGRRRARRRARARAPIHKTVPTDDARARSTTRTSRLRAAAAPCARRTSVGRSRDKEFTRLLRTERTPLNAVQPCWRGAVFVVPVAARALLSPVASAVPSEFGLPAIVALVLVLAALGCAWCLSKKVLMVKLGTLAFR